MFSNHGQILVTFPCALVSILFISDSAVYFLLLSSSFLLDGTGRRNKIERTYGGYRKGQKL